MTAPKRYDIQGLRAIAVLAVVLCHARVPGFGGGYVGVDTFFVISGFLITGILRRELDENGRIRFGRFYANRARRILPMAVLVSLGTVAAGTYWLSPLEADTIRRSGLASLLFVTNYQLANDSTDYLNATSAPSPFQHYWSLGVEEQFYLLWPVLLAVTSFTLYRGVHRTRQWSRVTPVFLLGLVVAASLALEIHLTRTSQPWAFFSLPTRAWELALGGLGSFAVVGEGRLSRRFATFVSVVGIAGIAYSILRYGGSTSFPGTAAIVPAVSAAILLVGGALGSSFIQRVLSLRVFTTIGDASYSWYLLHWPPLVIVAGVLGHNVSVLAGVGIVGVSLLAALVTRRFIEIPLMSARIVRATPKRGLVFGSALTLIAVLCTSLFPGTGVTAAANTHTARPVVTQPVIQDANGNAIQAVLASVSTPDNADGLMQTLKTARSDEGPAFENGCLNSYTDSTVHNCIFGNAAGGTTVMLFGDSHAAMWLPALEQVATARGLRIEDTTKAVCPPLELPIWSPVLHRDFTECTSWRASVLQKIKTEHPAYVVVGVARHYGDEYRFGDVYGPEWITGMQTLVHDIRSAGSIPIVMGPVPKPAENGPDCLASHPTSTADCLAAPISQSGVAAETAAVTAAGGTYIDTTKWFCANGTCPEMIDDVPVFRDDNHITPVYAATLAPAFTERFSPLFNNAK